MHSKEILANTIRHFGKEILEENVSKLQKLIKESSEEEIKQSKLNGKP